MHHRDDLGDIVTIVSCGVGHLHRLTLVVWAEGVGSGARKDAGLGLGTATSLPSSFHVVRAIRVGHRE